MSALKEGDTFPDNVTFSHVPPSPETNDIKACGTPVKYNASKEFKNKKVVLFAVPGAFTPTCQQNHLPGYIENLSQLRAKGVDCVVVIGFNDAWVMSAWGKANGIYDDSILFMSDEETAFSQKIGWTLGPRTGRYAMVIDHGKVTYAALEESKGVSVSGVDSVLAKL